MRVWRTGVKIIVIFSTVALVNLIWSSQAVFAASNISISLSTDQVDLDLVANNFNSVVQTINVSTTSAVGYTVNFATSGTTTSLVNKNDNTKNIPTIDLPSGSESVPVSSIDHGYGYSIDDGANYFPAPSASGDSVQIFETFAAGANSHALTYGAKASNTDVAGIYENTFTIYAVAKIEPCPAGNICYYGNGDDGYGSMDNQPAASNTDATLIPSNFSRSGYGFAGWNTEPDGSGTNYGPSQTITTGDLSAIGLQLYAKWVPSAGDFQGWYGCDAMDIGDVIALTDTRDNNTYAVAKYADKKCWMMENLRLDLSSPNVTITESNTNRPTSDFVTAVNNHPGSANNFCETYDANCTNQIFFNTNNTNRNLTASYNTNNNMSSWYSYGNYYNWYTATAGNGTYNFSSLGGVVNGDICPASWHLPTGYNGKSELALLDVAIGGDGRNQTEGDLGIAASARWRAYPTNLIYSGEQRGNTGYNRNVSGGYTTSNVNNADRAINLWIRPTAIDFVNNTNYKIRGQTIRCVASDDYSAIGNIHYDSNGGSGTMADEANVDLATAVAANNNFTKDNAEFVNWSTKSNGGGVVVSEGGLVASAAKSMGITDGETLVLYAVWRPIYTIKYDGNGSDAGSMDGFVHYNPASERIITLIAPNFSRSGYGFAGWSLDSNAANKIIQGDSVDVYGPNERINFETLRSKAEADANNNITLYAVWLPAGSNNSLQTFDVDACKALPIGGVTALTDARDNNTYAVARLKDENCWMMENLRLDPSAVTFSNANTNSPTADFITGALNYETSYNLCGQNTDVCINTVAFNKDNIDRNLTASYSDNDDHYSWYSYGVLYNWYTASAGNGTYSISSGNVSGDICPRGWSLPTGGNGSDFATLSADNGSSSNALRSYPNNFVFSGDYNQTTSGGRSTYSRYWSATASSNTSAYRLGLGYDDVTPLKAFNKWDAFAVRCIIRTD